MFDKLLAKVGLKYEDLNIQEKESLNSMVEAVQKSQLTLPKLKDYITAMREAVEQELCKTDLNTKQDIFLKARLRNYMLLETVLLSPKRASDQMEQMISGMIK